MDVVVLGSGAAGLAAALAVRPVRSVLVVTKDVLNAGSTGWAQGGLAAVLAPTDTFEDHVRDTLAAGAGLCDEAVVRELVAEAPTAIRYLMRLGAAFDPEAEGEGPALTMEGGHSHRRIVHSGGDRSGAEVQRTLDESATAAGAEVLERAFALDLVLGRHLNGSPQVAGVSLAMLDPQGAVDSVGTITARAVVLATGGYGQVFASTSNPPAVTGDGLAMALRAGLEGRDVEFVQFHPTVMWRGPDAVGQQALVSEAVRGEGAVLYDGAGRRVMVGRAPAGGPRTARRGRRGDQQAHGRGAGRDRRSRVPRCDAPRASASTSGSRRSRRRAGRSASTRHGNASRWLPPPTTRAAESPARLDGTTALAGLYAVGEVACTGVHGANRLASNSLTESVVAGTRLGRDLAWELPERVDGELALGAAVGAAIVDACPSCRGPPHDVPQRRRAARRRPRSSCRRRVGSRCRQGRPAGTPSRASWETTNILTVASAVVAAAARRTESRGSHRRTDFPESTRRVAEAHRRTARRRWPRVRTT